MNTSFWHRNVGKIFRWLSFLPIGLFLAGILQLLPPLAVGLARTYKPEVTFLTIILAIIAVSILGTLSTFWFIGVFMTPFLSCRVIAPNNKIAAVIFGTVFCLSQLRFLLALLGEVTSWVFLVYQLIFSGIIITGIVMSYKDDSFS